MRASLRIVVAMSAPPPKDPVRNRLSSVAARRGQLAADLPAAWSQLEGLVWGFGDKKLQPPGETLLLQRQVHGTRVVDASGPIGQLGDDAADSFARLPEDADALVSVAAGRVVGVRTADCVPILLLAPRERWAAAVHAGWRGTVAGIAEVAVRVAEEAGVHAGELLAILGPSIGPCCYEVSVELGQQFEEAGLPAMWPPGSNRFEGPGVAVGKGADDKRPVDRAENPGQHTVENRGQDVAQNRAQHMAENRPTAPAAGTERFKPHLDLRAANRLVLERAGLERAHVAQLGPCTRCASAQYHSFRAEPESPGRQISWIGWEG